MRGIDDNLFTTNNIVATDDYGRYTYSIDSIKSDKARYVGMFYFLNLGFHPGDKIYNVTKIIEEYGIEVFGSDNEYSPVNMAHVWGEPLWGYYHAMDKWVIRKQVEMLTMMGIDYIVFDTSNAVLYDKTTDVLLPILLEYQNAGWKVPQVAWHLAADQDASCREQIKTIYRKYYKKAEYKNLWFCPYDKPMVVVTRNTEVTLKSSNDSVEKEISNYFYFKYPQWPTWGYGHNGFPWMDFTYPQTVNNGVLSVSVGQHVTVAFSDTEGTRGRGWDYLTGKNNHELFGKNINLENQWKTAIENDARIDMVFLTGWNEWFANKMYVSGQRTNNGYMMCDTFNDEYSRDIEPTRESSLRDNCFVQTIRNIREYRGKEAKHYIYPKSDIDLSNFNQTQWANSATYLDFANECIERNWIDFSGQGYNEDYSNRNDIDKVQVIRSNEYLYFRVTTVDNITKYTSGDEGWMNIWLNTQNKSPVNEIGYQYVLNRNGVSNGKSDILKAKANGGYTVVGSAEVEISENVMMMKVPLSALNLDSSNYDIEFKVTDNIQSMDDILNFYTSGDSAPIGRLNYKFGY